MNELKTLVQTLAEAATKRGIRIATAESCTGGLIAATMTQVPGSSGWFDRGFVTYCNEAKEAMLDVDEKLIASVGVVSEEVARAMAVGAIRHSNAVLSVAVTGIAGPTGAQPGKPVGTVMFGFAFKAGETVCAESSTQHFDGDRDAVREAAAKFALVTLCAILSTQT